MDKKLCVNKECIYYHYEGKGNFCIQCGVKLEIRKLGIYMKRLKPKQCPYMCYPINLTHDKYCGNCSTKLIKSKNDQ